MVYKKKLTKHKVGGIDACIACIDIKLHWHQPSWSLKLCTSFKCMYMHIDVYYFMNMLCAVFAVYNAIWVYDIHETKQHQREVDTRTDREREEEKYRAWILHVRQDAAKCSPEGCCCCCCWCCCVWIYICVVLVQYTHAYYNVVCSFLKMSRRVSVKMQLQLHLFI